MAGEDTKQINPVAIETEKVESDGDRKIVSESKGKTAELSPEWVLQEINNAKKEVLRNAKEEAEKAIREQVQTDKASLITVFGIFASIVSFLTIEFQFLKTLCSFDKVLGFSLILFSLLFGFNVALDYLVKSRTDIKTPKPNGYFIVIVIVIFILGILFSYSGNEEICRENEIYQKYQKEYDQKIKDINSNMQKLNNKIDQKNNS